MSDRIATAAGAARREDQRMLADARAGLEQTRRELAGMVVSARLAEKQNRWLAGAAIGGVALGLALWAGLAGPIARNVAPESWHWPEQRAARALDIPMWQAGEQLMATADGQAFHAIIAGDRIIAANREAIDKCRKVAAKAGDKVRCTVTIGPER